jgi:dUTP pyrophosphatase
MYPSDNEMPTVKIKRLSPTAIIPKYQNPGDSGMDLHADFGAAGLTYTLGAGERMLVKCGVAIGLPHQGYEAQVRSRSGLALKLGVMVLNSPGTIDRGYRGEIGVILLNTSDDELELTHGDRIAQLVIAPVAQAFLVEVDGLSDTERGDGGFGSSGVKP